MNKLINNIPHGEYIKFTKDILELNDTNVVATCKFMTLPSFAMLIEASAQSAAYILKSNESIGFLVSIKKFILVKKIENLEYLINTKIIHSLGEMHYALTHIYNNKIIIAEGELSFFVTNKIKHYQEVRNETT